MRWCISTFAQVAIACVVTFGGGVEERTIIDNERCLAYSRPWMNDFSQLGGYEGSFGGAANQEMTPESLKIKGMVALQHIPLDANGFFKPIEELLAFERDEVRQGRAPLFVTATYDGKKRAVLCEGNLPGGGAAELYGPSLKQAVNVRDDRYIKFWVKNFLRRREPRLEHLWNWGIQLDTSIYRLKQYVVVDDEGQYHRVQWDEPFPQTEAEWMDAGKWALHRVKELAPDVLLLHNPYLGAVMPETRYGDVFEALDGTIPESFNYKGIFPSDGKGNKGWKQVARWIPPDGADAYKIQMFPWLSVNGHYQAEQLFLAYLVLSGPNAFFGPHSLDYHEIPPDWYAGMKNKLGSPIEHPEIIPEAVEEKYRMLSRRCEGGIVYINLSGTIQQITLPNDSSYYDQAGNPVSEVILDDVTATYVTTFQGERVAKPRINPRRPGLVTGPLTITLDTGPFTPADQCRIAYTLDGSEPDEDSTEYTGPFDIYESCVVKARAFPLSTGWRFAPLPSFTNFATYQLTDEDPTVGFHLPSDCGSEFLEHEYPVVSLSHVSAHPVVVTYRASGGTATYGSDYSLESATLTIRPGEQHRYFYMRILNDDESEPDETIMVSISNPVNAVLGEQTTYTYTIEDNDREPVVEVDYCQEGFETGDFLEFDWSKSPEWAIASEESNSGSSSAQCSGVTPNKPGTLEVTLDCRAGEVSFYRKVSCHSTLAGLVFSIDGESKGEWSGELDWEQVSVPVAAGTHTFTWTYAKIGWSSTGDDAAWIDDIEFPVP